MFIIGVNEEMIIKVETSLYLEKVKMNESVNEIIDKRMRTYKAVKINTNNFDENSDAIHYAPKGTMDIDSLRKDIVKEVNVKRMNTTTLDKNGNSRRLGKLRKGTVDTISGTIEFSRNIMEEYTLKNKITKISNKQTIKMCWRAIQEIEENAEKYGELLSATIYLYRANPLIHFVTSTIDEKGKPIANNKILAGKDKLAELKSNFANNVDVRISSDKLLRNFMMV